MRILIEHSTDVFAYTTALAQVEPDNEEDVGTFLLRELEEDEERERQKNQQAQSMDEM